MIPAFTQRRRFSDLSEQEILALAISSEEDDARIYRTYAERLAGRVPGLGRDLRRHGGRGGRAPSPADREAPGAVRRGHSADPSRACRGLLRPAPGLADGEPRHRADARGGGRHGAAGRGASTGRRPHGPRTPGPARFWATSPPPRPGIPRRPARCRRQHLDEDEKSREARAAHRQFMLTWVQPGLAGLMDGSVSTLAPIFAVAFATQDPWTTFLVGLAASVGAGISMGFTEAASDDGRISGRGSPVKRGIAAGVMTTVGRARPCAALSHPAFLDGDDDRPDRRLRGALGDRLDPEALHGDAVPAGGVPGGSGRRPGARGGDPDRKRVGAPSPAPRGRRGRAVRIWSKMKPV